MYTFESKCKVLSGVNALESISFEIGEKNLKNPLIISEKIVKELGILKKTLKAYGYSGPHSSIYVTNSNQATVEILNELISKYKNENHDSILAIGRNSVICLAKALKYLINTNSEDIENINKIDTKLQNTYLFVVPVFLGCAEEATSETTVYDIKKHRTYIIKSDMCEADAVFIDKRTLDVIPSSVVVNTCGYALLIALEAFSAKDTNCLVQTYAETAVTLIKDNLDNVLKYPTKLKLQIPLVEAVIYAGIAKSKVKLSIVDIVAKVISRLKQIPKEYVMFTMFLEDISLFIEDKEKLHSLLTSYSGEDSAVKTLQSDKADLLLNLIESKFKALASTFDLPKGLFGLGISRNDFQKIAEEVKFDIDSKKLNREVTTQEIQDILNKVYSEE